MVWSFEDGKLIVEVVWNDSIDENSNSIVNHLK